MELEGLIIVLYSQNPVIGSYSDLVAYISHSNIDFSKILLDIIFLSSKSPRWNLPLRFSNTNLCVGFDVLAAVIMKSVVTPRILLEVNLYFGETHCSETSVEFLKTAPRYIPFLGNIGRLSTDRTTFYSRR
jgi:hypothetical protein